LRNLAPQRAQFLKPRRNIAQDGRQADYAPVVVQGHNRELERNARSVLANAGNCKDITLAVPACPTRHHMSVSVPVALSQSLRNDDVQRLAERIATPATYRAPADHSNPSHWMKPG
jgi:hypothetical protein